MYGQRIGLIQLVAITKHKYLSTYGMDASLQPFIDDVKKLVSESITTKRDIGHAYILLWEKGFTFTVQGKREVRFGTLADVSADNLGSLALGGFKESCTAYRCCRQCMATRDTIRSKVCKVFF